MSPRTPMKVRGIRIPEATWQAAMEASVERGENLSAEIRKFLEGYASNGEERK